MEKRWLFLAALGVSGWARAQGVAYGDWLPLGSSAAVLARAGTGVTDPLAITLPEWSRSHVASVDDIALNPSLLGQFHPQRGRVIPLRGQSQLSGSAFALNDALSSRVADSSSLGQQLGEATHTPQSARVQIGSAWIYSDVGFAMNYTGLTLGVREDDGALFYRRTQDLSFQLGAAGPVFDDPYWGRFFMGMGLKSIARMGNDQRVPVGVSAALDDASMRKYAFAGGMDFGFLYSLPVDDAPLQLGFSWRDMGTTQFLGQSASTGTRLPYLANNPVVGLGWGLPNFQGALRQALRVEYSQWGRAVPFYEKWAVSWQGRLPALAQLELGLSGSQISAGAFFRFPGFELRLSSAGILLGEGGGLRKVRLWAMEIESAF